MSSTDDPGSTPAGNPQPDGGERRRVRPGVWFSVAAVVAVLAVVLWASSSTGERPTVGSGEPGAAPDSPGDPAVGAGDGSAPDPEAPGGSAAFAESVDAVPSGGCSDPAPMPATELQVDGVAVATALIVPPDDPDSALPASVMVFIGEPGTPAEDIAVGSGVFGTAGNSWRVAVTPSADAVPGDVARASATALGELVNAACIDMARMNAVGFGSGAPVAAALACEAPQLVSGLALVAGTALPDCTPDPAMSVRVVANGDDPTLDTGTALLEVGASWAEAVGATSDTVDGVDEDTLVRTWEGPGGVSVRTVWSAAGGHAWSIDTSIEVGPFLRDNARST